MSKSTGKVILIICILTIVIAVVASIVLLAYKEEPKIIIIPIRGQISVYGDGASSQRIIAQLIAAEQDDSVKAVILEVNSPGGTVVASAEIANVIEAMDKPVVTWMREIGASGAYWIASSTDYIVADPATLTGSIGVTSSYLQFADLMDKYGVTYESITYGEYKEAGSPYKNLTDEERGLLQHKVDIIGELFIAHIAKARGLPEETVRPLANGEILLGSEALKLGLIDELGGEATAFAVAKELSGAKDAVISTQQGGIGNTLQEFFAKSFYWIGRGVGDSFKLGVEKNSIITA